MKLHIISFVIIVYFAHLLQGEKILFYFAVSGYSHRISVWPIIEKLADSGHSVTLLSPYPAKVHQSHPNITDYVPEGLATDLGIMDLDFIGLRLTQGVAATDNLWDVYYKLSISACEALMRKQEFIEWVTRSSFDLVVVNALYNECGYGLVHKFKSKHVVYYPSSHLMWFKDAFGLVDENFSEMQYHYPMNMTFLQSVKNELLSLQWQYRRYTETFPIMEAMLKKGLQIPDLPPLDEIERNTSIIFTYNHPSDEYPRSLAPNFIDIGGIHCNDDRKPLPQELETFINSSGDDGFVLLSFGTYAALSSLPIKLQDIFFGTISRFPTVKFIVKFNGDPPKDLPTNVKTVQWIPQQDVIAHPKIRGFIGHGGLLGCQEAVYFGVPVILFPLFAEQDFQAVRGHERETAIALEISELTEDKLFNAIHEILNNKKYKENTMKISKLFRDRQNKPLDTAVWYIEYVLRHDDISFLRPIGIYRTWYQRRMLHIWGFLLACIIFSLTGFALLFYCICKSVKGKLCNRKKSKRD